MIAAVIICAVIIIGVLQMTGLGVKATSALVSLSDDSLWLGLGLTASIANPALLRPDESLILAHAATLKVAAGAAPARGLRARPGRHLPLGGAKPMRKLILSRFSSDLQAVTIIVHGFPVMLAQGWVAQVLLCRDCGADRLDPRLGWQRSWI